MKLETELDEINSIDRHINGSKLQPTVDFVDLTLFDLVPETTLSPEQMEKAILQLKENEKNFLVPYRMNNENAMPINGSGAEPKIGNGIEIGVGGGNKGLGQVKMPRTELAQEAKLLNLRAHIATHEHQINQLQKNNSKRLESYEQLKQKFNETTHDLQEQIYSIEGQVQSLQDNAIDSQAMLERLNNCEAQNARHETEFSLVNDVMVGAYTRMDAIEKRQCAQWQYLQNHVEQFKQAPKFQAEMVPSLVTGSRHACRKRRREIETDSTPTSKPSSSSPSSPSSPSTSSNPRSNCQFCNKSLSKRYIRIHVVNHCPKRPSPY